MKAATKAMIPALGSGRRAPARSFGAGQRPPRQPRPTTATTGTTRTATRMATGTAITRPTVYATPYTRYYRPYARLLLRALRLRAPYPYGYATPPYALRVPGPGALPAGRAVGIGLSFGF